MPDAHHRKVSRVQRSRAKTMRREPTDAEKKMWRLLRGHPFAQLKFRRQEPMGQYILDFVCFASKLVIEVDGGQHAESPHDAARDTWLAANGLTVVRYWNHDVLTNPEGVATDLAARLGVPL